MEKDQLSRKLAVILHADVVGSTSLVQQNETLAHERIQAAFKHFSETINAYGGLTREVRGDALVAEFDRASDAVAAALAFQADHTYLISRLKDDLRPTIRVGIAMGEVIIADDTVTGSGVVLAQRVEQLADSGGLCITAALHETLPKHMPFDLENLGEQVLKGFDDPVRVYRVELNAGQSVPAPERNKQHKESAKKSNLIVTVIVIALVVVGGTYYWFEAQVPQEEPASVERMAFPLPDKPSIAVLPFTNMSGVAEQEYFADGMTENLITDLSKVTGLFVIARNSSFSYKGQQVKVRQVSEDLGVRYVLEGSVQRAGNQVRINAQLIDATTGGHIWAERYDGVLADVFGLQDKITKRIVDALALQLAPQEARRIDDTGTNNVEAHDSYLLGRSFYNRRTPQDNATARDHFEKAIRLDPDYTAAYTALAKVYAQATVGGANYSKKLGINLLHGYSNAWRLLAQGLSQPNADYHVLRSWLALRKHQHDRAISEAEMALELNPNDVEAMEALAEALIFAGQPEAGIEFAQKSMRQNPTNLGRALYLIGTAEFAMENPIKALEYLDRAMRQAPGEVFFNGLLTAVYGELGQLEQAKAAFKAFGKYNDFVEGELRLSAAMSFYPFTDQNVLTRLANGFEAGGVSSGIGGYLPLHQMNKLNGSEIGGLLFGKEIKGHWFWYDLWTWRQQRTVDGEVEHFGHQIHPYTLRGVSGVGRIENDMLCEKWADLPKELEICVVIFRVPGRMARTRWGDYIMVTESGPHPFKLID